MIGCKKTYLKGTLLKNIRLNCTILATQKNKISHPVSKIVFGKNAAKSGCYSSGHPNVLKGNNPLLNQVSNTSSSYFNYILFLGTPYFASAF